MAIKNKVQLITYPDSLGGSLNSLKQILDKYFPDLFQGGIHLLPPFPSSGDRGFAPLTYFEIEERFGTWQDIRNLSANYDILLDLMVNHISKNSLYFQDFIEHGDASEYRSFFLGTEKIWADGKPVQDDIDNMFLRRETPYSEFTINGTGGKKLLWTTFGRETPSEQIDLDVNSDPVRTLFCDIMDYFSQNGVTIMRLDAVAYVIKKAGTSCFFVEPEICHFLDWMKREADKRRITLLPEVHAHHQIQRKLSEQGFWIYDFILPYVILDALLLKDGVILCDYLKDRPEKQFTMLDCHDGIPVKPDLDDYVPADRLRKIMEICEWSGGNFSRIVTARYKGEDGFDVHQIRGTYYSLLGHRDDAYIVARAIQMFVPGIPQVYYVGLLAGEHDLEAVASSGEAREINRHNYTEQEVARRRQSDVVKRLVRLIELRNEHLAFDGVFHFESDGTDKLQLQWKNGNERCELSINLEQQQAHVLLTRNGATETVKL